MIITEVIVSNASESQAVNNQYIFELEYYFRSQCTNTNG